MCRIPIKTGTWKERLETVFCYRAFRRSRSSERDKSIWLIAVAANVEEYIWVSVQSQAERQVPIYFIRLRADNNVHTEKRTRTHSLTVLVGKFSIFMCSLLNFYNFLKFQRISFSDGVRIGVSYHSQVRAFLYTYNVQRARFFTDGPVRPPNRITVRATTA